MKTMQNIAISVSQLNLFVKSLLDADSRLADVVICGEISNFSGHYRSGHLYFTLKDEQAAVKAVMFSRSAAKLRFAPQNGMKVIVRGRVSVYERDGVYQVYVEDMQPDGIGALSIAYEQLKKRLESEGLFAGQHKKRLPAYPNRIGVVTSPTGAAVQDILNILSRRWPVATVVFCPVSVQGDAAAGEISAAIAALDAKKACDVIIFGRGGGSVEDLWAFNDEMLVRTVYHCTTPIVSAVGHETDFTLCDFAADLRAPTPSAAAELVTPDINEEIRKNQALYNTAFSLVNEKIVDERERLSVLLRTRSFASPEHFFDTEKQYTDALTVRLKNARQYLLAKHKNKFGLLIAKMDSLSPLRVLSRGYAVVYENKRIITQANALHNGDRIAVSMIDGTVQCAVESVEIIEKVGGIDAQNDI